MPFALVALLSLLVGAAVYYGTIRRAGGSSATMGFGEQEEAEGEVVGTASPPSGGSPSPGYAYLQVSTRGPALRERLMGVFGLLVLMAVSAVGLAFAIYQVGHLINKTIEAFLDK